ncbi:MAG: hypothetical protein LQ345_001345 [Seirophora villosa]|nr:MAG: hypothetical protein LQ345_001345 [Seirophora villosa]
MVYDWDGKQETMRELYINQGKSLEEVMEWFRIKHEFTPSKRAFQTQIKKWNFPSKHTPIHTDAALVDRVRQLWAQNVSQKNMLATLHSEGFENVTDRELTRIRDREGLKLRVATAKTTSTEKSSVPRKRRRDEQVGPDGQNDHNQQSLQLHNPAIGLQDEHGQGSPSRLQDTQPASPAASTELTDEVVQKRQARFEKLQAESQERLEKRSRRRRTRAYAGLPPDPPAPPRFPSETTLEESKTILQLDKSTYIQIRAKFEEICQEHNVVKKTEAGPDKWQAVKNQLIEQFPPIQPMFLTTDPARLNFHFLALEMICNDVTKKLRTMKSKVTIADAKNVLGLDPEQGRQIKAVFHRILKEDHFTSKIETGPEHWRELKQRWINDLPLLQNILAPGEADPDHERKLKALEHLCRDVMKRLRDSQTKQQKLRADGSLAGQSASPRPVPTTRPMKSISPTDAPRPSERPSTSDGSSNKTTENFDGISTLASQALASAPLPMSPPLTGRQQHPPAPHDYGGQIDPTLLSAAANFPSYESQQSTYAPTPVYFRLAADSQIKTPPTIWVESLSSANVLALRQLAVGSRPYSNLSVGRIEGLIKGGNNESRLRIHDDDELMAYLQHLKGDSPTFVVQISYAT